MRPSGWEVGSGFSRLEKSTAELARCMGSVGRGGTMGEGVDDGIVRDCQRWATALKVRRNDRRISETLSMGMLVVGCRGG